MPVGLSQKIRASGRPVCRTVSLPVGLADAEFVGLLGQIADYLRRHPVDEILLTPGRSEATVIGRILYYLRVVPQPIILIPEPAVDALLKKPAMEIGSL